MDKLLPCPFCGSNNVAIGYYTAGGLHYQVRCLNCLGQTRPCYVVTDSAMTRPQLDAAGEEARCEAIAAWNQRANVHWLVTKPFPAEDCPPIEVTDA